MNHDFCDNGSAGVKAKKYDMSIVLEKNFIQKKLVFFHQFTSRSW